MEASILEQLHLQEGRLFQNERVLALYLDAKAVVLEALTVAGRAGVPLEFDDECAKLAEGLDTLKPKGTTDYHAKSLHEVCRVVAKLLWPTQILLVARPRVTTLLTGLCKRMMASEFVKSGQFSDLDPIKQDFVMREAFRRTLVNDCLVVFDENEDGEAPEEVPEREDVGPDDSASQARPRGARSTLGPIEDSDEDRDVVAPLASAAAVASAVAAASASADDDVKSTVKSMQSFARLDARSVAPSVAPRVMTVRPSDSESASSRATGLTATSVMRRPFNVRKIQLEEDINK